MYFRMFNSQRTYSRLSCFRRKNHLLKRFQEFDPEKTGFVSKDQAKKILEEEIKGMPESTINNMVNR